MNREWWFNIYQDPDGLQYQSKPYPSKWAAEMSFDTMMNWLVGQWGDRLIARIKVTLKPGIIIIPNLTPAQIEAIRDQIPFMPRGVGVLVTQQ